MAVLGLRFCARAFSSCGKWGPLFIAMRGPLLLRSTGSRGAGSVIVAHGPSCSAACGIFPDQGSNPCPLHWQADSQPLRHQGSPVASFYATSRVGPYSEDTSAPSVLGPAILDVLDSACILPVYVKWLLVKAIFILAILLCWRWVNCLLNVYFGRKLLFSLE